MRVKCYSSVIWGCHGSLVQSLLLSTQVWCSPTILRKDATDSTSSGPSKPARIRTQPSLHLSSSSQHGRRGWIGVTLAGWLMAQCSIQSQTHVQAVGVWTSPLAYAATGNGIDSSTTLMLSASPRLSRVSMSVCEHF